MVKTNALDYIIVYELYHLEHKDHSQAFWDKVSSVIPNYEVDQEWLKNNSVNMDV